MVTRATLSRLAYGAVFVVLLPLGLVAWALRVDGLLHLPAIHSVAAGLPIAVVGLLLIALGMRALIRHGDGLPMNAFPPPRFVRRGIYGWLHHPIYLGAGLLAAGVALFVGSAAGLWAVTPLVALGGAALAHGHERHDLRRRFGAEALGAVRLSLPLAAAGAPAWSGRVAVYLWALLPWLLVYCAVQALGRPPDAFETALALERQWPVVQWTEALYVSAYLVVPLTPLLVRQSVDLRRFAIQGIIGTIVVGLLWLIVPVVAANRPFVPAHLVGRLLAFEQRTSVGVAAFPAFHVLWSLIAAQALASTASARHPRWRGVAWSWAALVTLSCLTTGAHTLIEVGAAILLYLPLRHPAASWSRIRGGTEWLANSWREWRIGPIRVIGHGGWAALAAGTGVLVAGAAVGAGRSHAIAWLALGGLLGAGLWAQALEGSSRLLRPFGWYGGMAGGVVAALLCRFEGIPVLALLAALAVAAPWIQLLGRLRCLVQGCCHGGPTDATIGIHYRHRRSRVTHLAGLAGTPIHATPLYSIAGNLVIGLLLVRLRALGVADATILASYLSLAGLARFVEEGFRAEPQTPWVAGLRIYQWFAVTSVLAGLLTLLLPSEPVAHRFERPPLSLGVLALIVALAYGAAMGVDFPGSNRRFARLAAAD